MEARGVGQEAPDRDARKSVGEEGPSLGEGSGRFQGVELRVEVEAPQGGQAEGRRGGEEFGDRGEVEAACRGHGNAASVEVDGEAETFLEKEFAAALDTDDEAGRVVSVQALEDS
jgi:hypothetical protein